MDNTPLLSLPLLANKQALQTTFHDEALKALDALVMLSVIDRDLSSPPASPAEGDRYIVKAPGSGDDAWEDDNVVVFVDGHWKAHLPQPGWTCYVQDEAALIAWDGTDWQPALDVLGGGAANNLALLGVGTTADTTNPFSAKLNNALWAARTIAEGGDGDLRCKMSKASAADTLSILLQDNFSGRAEIGLTGDDDLHFKTSADGSAWIDALVIDRATGGVRFLAHETSVASAATCDIGAAASLKVHITGATAITSFGTQPHCLKFVRFGGALTLTHNATSLMLPGAGNIATAAGDTAIFVSDADGNWRCWHYQRATTGSLTVTNSIGADVAMDNIGLYFTGPTIAQGTSGTWWASGQVTVYDTGGNTTFLAKLWDGTTVIDSAYYTATAANQAVVISLSGFIANPAGNIRISVNDQGRTTGVIGANLSGNAKDSTVSAIRIQ